MIVLPHKFEIEAPSLEVAFMKAREWTKDNTDTMGSVVLHFVGAKIKIRNYHHYDDELWDYEFEIRKA